MSAADPTIPPPVVCLGTGGSGTRGIAAIMRAVGVFIGTELNRSLDALTFKPFLREWAEPFVASSHWIADAASPGRPRPAEIGEALRDSLADAARAHRSGGGDPARWGWKAPRTIFTLPVVLDLFPQARVVQLVRDGRDMALSRNQHQLAALGDTVLGPARDGEDERVRSIQLWSAVNLAAVRYATAVAGERHLVVRYEDLCADRDREVARLLAHLGVEREDAEVRELGELVQPSSTLGRWRELGDADRVALGAAAPDALERFGYPAR